MIKFCLKKQVLHQPGVGKVRLVVCKIWVGREWTSLFIQHGKRLDAKAMDTLFWEINK